MESPLPSLLTSRYSLLTAFFHSSTYFHSHIKSFTPLGRPLFSVHSVPLCVRIPIPQPRLPAPQSQVTAFLTLFTLSQKSCKVKSFVFNLFRTLQKRVFPQSVSHQQLPHSFAKHRRWAYKCQSKNLYCHPRRLSLTRYFITSLPCLLFGFTQHRSQLQSLHAFASRFSGYPGGTPPSATCSLFTTHFSTRNKLPRQPSINPAGQCAREVLE
jgi:hypothetical protein